MSLYSNKKLHQPTKKLNQLIFIYFWIYVFHKSDCTLMSTAQHLKSLIWISLQEKETIFLFYFWSGVFSSVSNTKLFGTIKSKSSKDSYPNDWTDNLWITLSPLPHSSMSFSNMDHSCNLNTKEDQGLFQQFCHLHESYLLGFQGMENWPVIYHSCSSVKLWKED